MYLKVMFPIFFVDYRPKQLTLYSEILVAAILLQDLLILPFDKKLIVLQSQSESQQEKH